MPECICDVKGNVRRTTGAGYWSDLSRERPEGYHRLPPYPPVFEEVFILKGFKFFRMNTFISVDSKEVALH
jgi:hypothetical protein